MRRIDVIGIGIGTFALGGVLYGLLQVIGLEAEKAGIWSQALLMVGLLGWVATYIFRAATKNMTYAQQIRDYEESVLQKRLDELSPADLAKLQAEIEQERQAKQKSE